MNFIENYLISKYQNKTFSLEKGVDESGAAQLRYILTCVANADSARNGHDMIICLKALKEHDSEIFDTYLEMKASETPMPTEVRLGMIAGLKEAVSKL